MHKNGILVDPHVANSFVIHRRQSVWLGTSRNAKPGQVTENRLLEKLPFLRSFHPLSGVFFCKFEISVIFGYFLFFGKRNQIKIGQGLDRSLFELIFFGREGTATRVDKD